MKSTDNCVGVLLAGGLARRMGGGDKCLLPLGDKTLLSRSIERARNQVGTLVLSANGNALRFARSKIAVVPDVFAHHPGPMAGIHAAMLWMAENRPECEWLASFACDTPFFPQDLVARLQAAVQQGPYNIAVARDTERLQPVFALWHKSLLPTLEATLKDGQIPWLQHWIAEQNPVEVAFADKDPEPFFNINSPQDLYRAQEMLTQQS